MAYTGQSALNTGYGAHLYRPMDAVGYTGKVSYGPEGDRKLSEFRNEQYRFKSVQRAASLATFVGEHNQLAIDLDEYLRDFTQGSVTRAQTEEFNRKCKLYDNLTKFLVELKVDVDAAIKEDSRLPKFNTHAKPALEYFTSGYDVTSYPTAASIKKRRGVK